jgi:hypothetical protein
MALRVSEALPPSPGQLSSHRGVEVVGTEDPAGEVAEIGEPTQCVAAVDGEALARDVRRGGHREERDDARDLLGLGDAAERRARQDRGELVGLREDRLDERGPRVPRGDGVDANAIAGPLERERARGLCEPGFRGGVGNAGRQREQPGDQPT